MLYRQYFETYLKEFCTSSAKQVNEKKWNYPSGCILMGAQRLYEATGEEPYLDGLRMFGDLYVDEQGLIEGYVAEEHNVDMMCSGNMLYFLYEQTGQQRFRQGIDFIMENMKAQPRTSYGNFWHKGIYPHQVWLDGLYMAQPFYLRYETLYHGCEKYEDIIDQFRNVRKYIYDDQKHLYYHAYDEKRQMVWADKETGLSPCFWLRAMGWYLMALVDCYEIMAEGACDQRQVLADLLREAVDGILPYKDRESGLFFQLIDRKGLEGNYGETSGSAMVSYAILKGCRLGILNTEQYGKEGRDILLAIEASSFVYRDGRLHLTGTCASAGLGPNHERDGSAEYYLSEAVKEDNAHGAAACMLAYSEWLRRN